MKEKVEFRIQNLLPLKNMFCNKEIELDYNLDDIKLFYTILKLQEENDFNSTSPWWIKLELTSLE